jgi:signal transduction histidine kinase
MVTVRQSPEALVMEIEDNGCGFEVERQRQAALPAHFGILGMRERAACLGGAFEIHSHPGKGTRIRLRLPMGGTIPAKGTLLEVPA